MTDNKFDKKEANGDKLTEIFSKLFESITSFGSQNNKEVSFESPLINGIPASRLLNKDQTKRLKATANAVILELRAFMSLDPLDEELLEIFTVILQTMKVSSKQIERCISVRSNREHLKERKSKK